MSKQETAKRIWVENMLKTGDRAAWRGFLAACDTQDAVYAHLRATQAGPGLEDMRALAWKRVNHLNGEHRHPELWG